MSMLFNQNFANRSKSAQHVFLRWLSKSAHFLIFSSILIVSVIQTGRAETVINVGTGDINSASWQFTDHISAMWKRAYPDQPLDFVPIYEPDLEKRFDRLQEGYFRLVVAPLSGQTEALLLNQPVKILSLLWQVYLVPIDLSGRGDPVQIDNQRYWYLRTTSMMAPALARRLGGRCLCQSIRDNFEKEGFFDADPQKFGKKTDSIDSSTDIRPEAGYGFSRPATGENIPYPSLYPNKIVQQSPPTRQPGFSADIICIQQTPLSELLSEYRNGIVFFEMAGPVNNLLRHLWEGAQPIPLDPTLHHLLQEEAPWTTPISVSGLSFNPPGCQMGLFVNESEDEEWVQQVLAMMANPPPSRFPRSYLMDQLFLTYTRELSPLILHSGTLAYFELN